MLRKPTVTRRERTLKLLTIVRSAPGLDMNFTRPNLMMLMRVVGKQAQSVLRVFQYIPHHSRADSQAEFGYSGSSWIRMPTTAEDWDKVAERWDAIVHFEALFC